MELNEVINQRAALRQAIKQAMAAQEEACKPLHDALRTCNAYIISQIPEMTDEQLMDLRFQAVEDAGIIAGQQKAAVESYNTEIAALEARIKELMLARGAQQLKVNSGHETHFTTKDSVTVQDMDTAVGFMLKAAPPPEGFTRESTPGRMTWSEILYHIQTHGMWGLLTKALHKTNTREVLESGVPPDTLGVKFSTYRDLVWSRGKS